jgi:tRNA(adenine34) deaminase
MDQMSGNFNLIPPFVRDPNLIGYWMNQALNEAKKALASDEVPVGAVLIHESGYIMKNHNRIIGNKDPLAHAEILVIRAMAELIQNERTGGVLFVTLEPCVMCAGAAILARLDAIVFGAPDPKSGACGTAINALWGRHANHRVMIFSGILEEPCSALLRDFFRHKRTQRKAGKKSGMDPFGNSNRNR